VNRKRRECNEETLGGKETWENQKEEVTGRMGEINSPKKKKDGQRHLGVEKKRVGFTEKVQKEKHRRNRNKEPFAATRGDTKNRRKEKKKQKTEKSEGRKNKRARTGLIRRVNRNCVGGNQRKGPPKAFQGNQGKKLKTSVCASAHSGQKRKPGRRQASKKEKGVKRKRKNLK